jgi:hypothetical protein
MDMIDPKARLVGRVRTQGSYKLGKSDWRQIAFNRAALKRLSIGYSVAAKGSLTGKGANPILAQILAIVDLGKCETAQAAVLLINANRNDAMTRAWHGFDFKLPVTEGFFLREVAQPASHKYMLDTKPYIITFEDDLAKTRRP